MAPPNAYIAFQPLGSTAKIAANFVAPAGVQLVGDTSQAPMTWRQYRVMNDSNQTIFYAYGANASLAQSAAVIPTNSDVGAGSFPLPPGGVEVITAPAGRYWSGTCAVNTAVVLYITPGIGL